jgi:hypothetical protein
MNKPSSYLTQSVLCVLSLFLSGCCFDRTPQPAPFLALPPLPVLHDRCLDCERCGASLQRPRPDSDDYDRGFDAFDRLTPGPAQRDRAINRDGKVFARVTCTQFIAEVDGGGVMYFADQWESEPPDGRRYTPSLASEEFNSRIVDFVAISK